MWEAMMPQRLITLVCLEFSVTPKFSVNHAGRGLPLAARARPTPLPVNR
ncbi:hypothetical protein [Mesorhizobium qingshengii]|jgi:hypothetical protein|uniref:Uncharacterized protein n=1 Tax=Mesorhizobium qingshengii TaxID=1165689 RepID=A0A1G5ZR65_9HYPH|nr:hypothetical protein [Mesorhizobium qingshengii]SDA97328.1 hypothetical protein SAMN02927914_05841 [Mesorhizobium qingshengii]